MFEIVQIIIYLVFLVCLILSIYVVKSFGKGVLNILFIPFAFGVSFLGLSMLFGYLQDIGMYNLSDVTFHVWWHVLVYLSLASIIWGGYRLKGVAESKNPETFGPKDKTFFGTLILIAITIFLLAPAVESSVGPALTGSIVDTLGLHHLMIFVGGSISGWYLSYIKGKWGLISTSINFMIGFLLFIAGWHFWEVINESWKILTLDEEIVEGVELFFLLPALVLFAIGEWKIIRFIKDN